MVDISKRFQWVDLEAGISAESFFKELIELNRVNAGDISYTFNFVLQHFMSDYGFEANFDAFLRCFPFWQSVFPLVKENSPANHVESGSFKDGFLSLALVLTGGSLLKFPIEIDISSSSLPVFAWKAWQLRQRPANAPTAIRELNGYVYYGDGDSIFEGYQGDANTLYSVLSVDFRVLSLPAGRVATSFGNLIQEVSIFGDDSWSGPEFITYEIER